MLISGRERHTGTRANAEDLRILRCLQRERAGLDKRSRNGRWRRTLAVMRQWILP